MFLGHLGRRVRTFGQLLHIFTSSQNYDSLLWVGIVNSLGHISLNNISDCLCEGVSDRLGKPIEAFTCLVLEISAQKEALVFPCFYPDYRCLVSKPIKCTWPYLCDDHYICNYRTRVRSLGMLVTNFLTDCLVNLVDVTLACEDDNSKLVTVIMLKMRNVLTTVRCRFGRWFGHKVKFLFRLWAQGFKVWSIFCSWCSGKILKLKFGHCFAADASCGYEVQSWSRFWR